MLVTVVAIYSVVRGILLNVYECIERVLLGSGILMTWNGDKARAKCWRNERGIVTAYVPAHVCSGIGFLRSALADLHPGQ